MAAALTAAAEGGGLGKRAACSACTSALLVLAAAAAFGQFQVSAVDVITVTEYFVQNGTDLLLSCTFVSSEAISAATSVTWSFKQLGSTTHAVTLFYYTDGKSYPGNEPQFKDRITWVGDFNKKDASIKITRMTPADNGTYFCDVKNPPDIVVQPGQIEVRVLEKEAETTTAVDPELTTVTSASTMAAENMARSKAVLYSLLPFLLKFCCVVASFFLF
ncbi:hypothetical protein lerEdw1_011371 [Lerista edwardsae]|nr:hypothetical protein lerEdw1_011371 [Lerista edwardsae]